MKVAVTLRVDRTVIVEAPSEKEALLLVRMKIGFGDRASEIVTYHTLVCGG